MNRMKTFIMYLIIFVVLYFASNMVIDFMLKSNYSNISSATIDTRKL